MKTLAKYFGLAVGL